MMSDTIEVLGWTLLHFVWQGAVVGVLAALLLVALRRRSANARYLLAVAALGLMLLLPLGTIARIEQTPPPGEVAPIFNTVSMIEIPRTREDGTLALDEPPIKVERIGIDFDNPPPPDAVPQIPISDTGQTILEDLAEQRSAFRVESFLKPFIPWAVGVWLIGVGVLSLRLFASWWSVRRLRCRATQPAGESWQALLRQLSERLCVTRPVKLVESALVEVPAVIGWLRPVILLPATAMTGLTTEQLEALLAHELAHVRRHDYVVNVLQTIVETLLFYHPAVWWLSHRIRLEREHCCDDLAASVCGDRLSYAKALVAMEELRAPKVGLAMSSNGGSLLTRVARLLGATDQQRCPAGWFAWLLVIGLLTMAGALGVGLLTSAEEPAEKLLKSDGRQSKTEREIENDDQVAATVNGVKILEAEVLEPFGEQRAMLRNQLSPAEYQKARRELLEKHLKRHIERQLLVQESDRTIWPEGRKEVDRAAKEQFEEHVEKLMRELKIADRKQLDQQLKNRGSSLTLIEAEFLREQHASQFLGRKYHFGGWETGGDFIDQLWRQAEIKTTYDVAKGRGISDELRDPQNQRVREALRSPAETAFSEVPLRDTLKFFADFHNVRINPDVAAIPNWNAVAQTPITYSRGGDPLGDEAFGVVLASMLEPLQLTYRVANGELLITTAEDFQRRGEKLPMFVTADAEVLNTRIRNELPQPTDASFFNSRLEDVLLFYNDWHNIRVGPDLAAISNWKELAETPITMEYRRDALGVVLNSILKPLRLRYRIDNGELLITNIRSDQAVGSGDQPEKPTEGLPKLDDGDPQFEIPNLKSQISNPKPEARGEQDASPTQKSNAEREPPAVQTEAERARLAVLRQKASNDVNIRFAQKSAAVVKAEWDKMLEANRKVPGAIPESEIERARLNHVKAVLLIEKAEIDRRIHQLELERALGQKTADEAELNLKSLDIHWRAAKATADVAKAEYDKILDANRRVPGSVSEAHVTKARTTWEVAQKAEEAARSQHERAQLEHQIAAELKKLTEVAFTDTPLTDVMTFLSDYHNIPVEVDASAKKFADSPVTLTLIGADLAEALTLSLHPLPLSYCIDEGRLLVATPAEIQRLGHMPARRFAEELDELKEVDATIPWETLLRAESIDDPVTLAKTVVPKLNALLKHRNEDVQRLAARSLTQFGELAPLGPLVTPDRQALEKLTKSKNPRAARAAWLVLVAIGESDFSTLPLLLAELDSNEAFVDLFAGLLRQFDPAVWRELAKVFPTSSLRVRATLASSLRLHPDESVPVALLALADSEASVRRTALRNYRAPQSPDELFAAIRSRLTDSEQDIRVLAAERLLNYGKFLPEAIDVILTEAEREGPQRLAQSLLPFLHIGSSELVRPVIDVLDLPIRTGSDSRQWAARRALAMVGIGYAARNNLVPPWGPTRNGLRTRLSPVGGHFEEVQERGENGLQTSRVFVSNRRAGQPIKLTLELTNVGQEPFNYNSEFASVNQPFAVFDAGGHEVKYIGGQVSTAVRRQTIKSGETHVIFQELDLASQYQIKKPGYYLVQWTKGSRNIRPDNQTTTFLPNSNVLTLEIQEAANAAKKLPDVGANKPGRFVGRVRLKTEKPMPDLEKVELPAGKVLDESLVFSKDGGLANVFVYLRKPTFPIEPPAEVELAKPFVLIVDSGKFSPHAAFVRTGRPVVLENGAAETMNIHTHPIRNNPVNVSVPPQGHIKAPAFDRSENIPLQVKNDLKPWMLAHVLALDHPFAAITDDEGRFAIKGLPPGEHDFRMWHERVGWLEKSLVITIKPGEDARSELEYVPDRLKLTEAEVLAWGKRLIDAKWVPQLRVPRPAVPPPKDEKPSEISNLKSQISDAKPDAAKLAIERGIAFLKAQQQDGGTWQGTPVDGVTALCAVALLQAGVKSDDPVIQKSLAHLRKVEQTLSYTVALQTMVFCGASPKEDAELILRNVEWLEKAQVTKGELRGAWSYAVTNLGVGDSSCSRFAVMGLHAAKRAGFEVKAETWRHVSDYWLTTQKDQGRWGYTPQSAPTPTMTLAGIACLATANRYLPQDEQTKTREAAMRKPAEYLEKVIPDLTKAGFALYSLQSLERAGHISGIKEFGKLDWQADLTKRLLETQHPNGSWKGSTPTESELVATGFALLALTGQPEPKLVGRRLRIEPRDKDKPLQVRTDEVRDSVPLRQRVDFSGGVRIEILDSDGSKCRIEADRAVIEYGERVNNQFEFNHDSDVTRVACIGSVKLEAGIGEKMTRLTGENLELDFRANGGWLNQRPEWINAIVP